MYNYFLKCVLLISFTTDNLYKMNTDLAKPFLYICPSNTENWVLVIVNYNLWPTNQREQDVVDIAKADHPSPDPRYHTGRKNIWICL